MMALSPRYPQGRPVQPVGNDLGPKRRLEAALGMCEQLLDQVPVKGFKIDPGGGGNWDDVSIKELCERVGCRLVISRDVSQAAKRHIRDNMGALKLVKDRRNRLAHGSLSFVECCGETVTVGELKEVADAVSDYLREAVGCFDSFIAREIVGKRRRERRREVRVS
ncbi:MAE_28990/MAE_18760 family HEPN-like nuclease [Actinomyces lilanjuaniae]|nr:MAE_28990/MAE_18760 family HEPN-like nuclease [Actinomyces lilanjuaniae]